MSVTDFRRAPGRAMRWLSKSGLVLFSHNRICGYVIGKATMDQIRFEMTRARRAENELSELLRAVHPDLLRLRVARPELRPRIDAALAAMIATHPEVLKWF